MSSHLPVFDLRDAARSPGVFLVFGKSQAGKTELCKALLRAQFPEGARGAALASQTCGMRWCHEYETTDDEKAECHEYRDVFPPSRLRNLYHSELATALIEDTEADGRRAIVLDDVLFETAPFERHPELREATLRGPARGLSVVVTSQYPFDVPTDIREAVDYVFLFDEPNVPAVRKRLCKNFGGRFPSEETFLSVLKDATKSCGDCLVLSLAHRDDGIFRFNSRT